MKSYECIFSSWWSVLLFQPKYSCQWSNRLITSTFQRLLSFKWMNRHWESQWSKLSMETLSLLWWGLWWCYLPHAKITPEFILELDYCKKKFQSFSNPHQLAVNHFVNYCLIFLRHSFYFKYFTWKSKKKVSKKVFLSIKPISHMQLSLPGSLLPLWDVYGCWWGSEEAPGGRGLVYHWRFL